MFRLPVHLIIVLPLFGLLFWPEPLAAKLGSGSATLPIHQLPRIDHRYSGVTKITIIACHQSKLAFANDRGDLDRSTLS